MIAKIQETETKLVRPSDVLKSHYFSIYFKSRKVNLYDGEVESIFESEDESKGSAILKSWSTRSNVWSKIAGNKTGRTTERKTSKRWALPHKDNHSLIFTHLLPRVSGILRFPMGSKSHWFSSRHSQINKWAVRLRVGEINESVSQFLARLPFTARVLLLGFLALGLFHNVGF